MIKNQTTYVVLSDGVIIEIKLLSNGAKAIVRKEVTRLRWLFVRIQGAISGA